jgi:uncharacterized membrane protein
VRLGKYVGIFGVTLGALLSILTVGDSQYFGLVILGCLTLYYVADIAESLENLNEKAGDGGDPE